MKLTHLLKRYCFALLLLSAAGYAQDDAKITSIANEACNCTEKISVEQPRDSIIKKINECIRTFIVTTQMVEESGGNVKKQVENTIAKGEQGTTVVQNGKTYTIDVNKNFDEIQEYMFNNCESVKMLISTNNGLLDYSMSKNKKALKFYNEGTDYEVKEMYDMAIVSYTKALKADSKFSFAWDNLGLCYRKRGNYKEAIKCYEKSLELDPKGTTPLQNIAVAYDFLKDYKNAAATYEKFKTLHPDNPEGYFGAGRTYYIINDFEKGTDNMFKAYKLYKVQKSPYVNDALQNLRFYYNDLKEKNKLDIFNQAAKNNNVNIKE